MPRSKTRSLKRQINPDQRYNSVLVQKLINKVMWRGKKMQAETLVYRAFDEIGHKAKTDPLSVFEQAIRNISPVLEVKSRRVGGATYQIPYEVKGDRQVHLALMWLLAATRSRRGKSFDKLLADEIMDAYKEQGTAFKKKEDTHKMAEANRAFAHLARF